MSLFTDFDYTINPKGSIYEIKDGAGNLICHVKEKFERSHLREIVSGVSPLVGIYLETTRVFQTQDDKIHYEISNSRGYSNVIFDITQSDGNRLFLIKAKPPTRGIRRSFILQDAEGREIASTKESFRHGFKIVNPGGRVVGEIKKRRLRSTYVINIFDRSINPILILALAVTANVIRGTDLTTIIAIAVTVNVLRQAGFI